MGLPRLLQNMNAYANGTSYLGVIGEFEQPKLALKMDDWRGGGMPGPVKIDQGLDALEATLTFGGHELMLVREFGTPAVNGTRLRLVCAYQANDGSAAQAVHIFIGGRFSEIDFGKDKPGDATEHKYKAAISYYRREVDGVVEIEIDMVNGIFVVGGIDRYAEIMSIITS